jgi:hypothetical protein
MNDVRVMNLWPVLGALMLLLIGGEGLFNAFDNSHSAATGMQWTMTALQFGYAVFSPVPVVARWKFSRYTVPALLIWGLLLTAAVFLSPIVWAETGFAAGIGSGLGAAVVAALVGWVLCRGLSAGR